jgi:proteic killer suppression protein
LVSNAYFDIVTALQLAFATKSLRQLCESEAIAKRKLGVSVAEKLKRRLADLRAATSIKDLVVGRPHEVAGDSYSHLALELCEGSRLVFSANHNTVPVLKSGGVDWSKVRRVKIQKIERDHG